MPMPKPRRSALASLLIVLVAAGAARAQVGVTDGPKGVVVNPRTGKAYAAFPDLGVVKILDRAGGVTTLKTGANVKSLTLNPNTGQVYAMNRGPGTISVIDPDERRRHRHAEGRSRQLDRAQSRDRPALCLGQHRHRSVGHRSRDRSDRPSFTPAPRATRCR